MRSTHYSFIGSNACFFRFGKERPLNLIIATSNVDFAQMLKEGFRKRDVNVLEIVTCLEDLFEVLAVQKNVDGILLKTDLAIKGNDHRLEMLSDSILSLRKTPEFENIVFSVLTDYPEGHPLLAEFFGMGIYNFFSRGTSFNIENLIRSFENPMSFSIAVKYRDANPEFAWRRKISNPQTYHVKFENTQNQEEMDNKAQVSVEEEIIDGVSQPKERRSLKIPQINISLPKVEPGKENQLDEEWFLNNQLEQNDSKAYSSVVGSVIISVAAVKEHLGATNTAMNIAKYLKDTGHDVALVEANKSLDFDRIHSLKEAENLAIDDMEFTFQGIDHFKYRDGFDIGRIYQMYQYIVLDIGVIEDSPYKDEFVRSHIKLVTASGDEWKHYWIEEFLLNHQLSDLIFLLPCSNESVAEDVSYRLKDYYVYPLEKNESPYIVPEDSAAVYERILKAHQVYVGNRVPTSKKQVIGTAAITVVIMSILFISLMIFLK